jgi:hypothetical protein
MLPQNGQRLRCGDLLQPAQEMRQGHPCPLTFCRALVVLPLFGDYLTLSDFDVVLGVMRSEFPSLATPVHNDGAALSDSASLFPSPLANLILQLTRPRAQRPGYLLVNNSAVRVVLSQSVRTMTFTRLLQFLLLFASLN